MADVVILGGHGKVALLLAPLLVARGDGVTSVFRNPDHEPEVAATGARPVVADLEALGTDQIADLLRGHDTVVWSAGAGGGSATRTFAVDRDAAIRSIDAAAAAAVGVGRYVMVSYLGAGPDHGVAPDDPFFAYAEAKAAADEHLRRSSLAATVLGPGRLTLDPPTGTIEVVTGRDGGDTAVSRADVAAVVAAVLRDDTTAGRTLDFRRGPTPIAEAIRG